MVLKIVGAAISAFFPTQYVVHIVIGVVTILVLRAFSKGRTTNRERDLHARTIVITVCKILNFGGRNNIECLRRVDLHP